MYSDLIEDEKKHNFQELNVTYENQHVNISCHIGKSNKLVIFFYVSKLRIKFYKVEIMISEWNSLNTS